MLGSLVTAALAALAAPPPASAFHGRWLQIEVTLEVDESGRVGPAAREGVARSTAVQARVRERIARGDLAVVTRFNPEGTYTHEVLTHGPGGLAVTYSESGRWAWDPVSRTLTKEREGGGVATGASSRVLMRAGNDLTLRIRLGGGHEGVVETVRLRWAGP